MNGLTELAVTKLDVLSMFERIPVCTGYRLSDGTVTTDFPAHQTDFHHAQPVYERAGRVGHRHLAVTRSRTCPSRPGVPRFVEGAWACP